MWIVGALAVLSVGGVVVPIDDLADGEQLKAALVSSAAQVIFTTARHLESNGEILRTHASRVILVDEDEGDGRLAMGWRSLLGERTQDPPAPAPDEPALLSWTSGTTGSPKAFFLTHRNIATNIEALQKLNVVGLRDRALLPLPLHHAYGVAVHGEVRAGDLVIWLHRATPEHNFASPRSLAVATGGLVVHIDDVDAHHAHAGERGARIETAPKDQPYGQREYGVSDTEGHRWWFASPLK